MGSTNISDRALEKGAQRWLNPPQVRAISHILALGLQHLELVVGGRTPPLRGLSLLITERINFVVFLLITAASLKCSVRHTMVTETLSAAFCFHFLVFYKRHAFSLFCSNIQGPGILRVKRWERISSCSKNASFEYHFGRFFCLFFLSPACFSVCHTFQFRQILPKC